MHIHKVQLSRMKPRILTFYVTEDPRNLQKVAEECPGDAQEMVPQGLGCPGDAQKLPEETLGNHDAQGLPEVDQGYPNLARALRDTRGCPKYFQRMLEFLRVPQGCQNVAVEKKECIHEGKQNEGFVVCLSVAPGIPQGTISKCACLIGSIGYQLNVLPSGQLIQLEKRVSLNCWPKASKQLSIKRGRSLLAGCATRRATHSASLFSH